ncbi:unnamed protein product [Trifolium pratense]|uniref:Uncharacterized protein n=1 Tax=Trifolium pratense TaxID=57577 RepID=A0ACB0IBY8_TRIPR|nr:unnamed protein product [Trifolium pratense]
MIFSLYFQIILSFAFSFLLHLFNFKKHLNSFITLLTLINITGFATNNNNNNNLKFVNPSVSFKSKPKPIISISGQPKIREMERFVNCTESVGFENIDENDEYEGEYCPTKKRGVNSSNTFPPPLSSLGGNGQPSFILLPVRKNGMLQLNKVEVKRPTPLYASRQDGRLRLYLVPDQCYIDDMEQEEESDEEDENEEEEEESTIVESESSEEKMVEESRYEEDDRVREWNKQYRRKCHQEFVSHIHGSHNNLLMCGVGIA